MSRRCRALNGIAFCGLAMYLVLAFVSFFTFVEPSLNGTNGWRVYADSDVYMDVANYIRNQGDIESAVALLSLARNLILPAVVVLTLGTDAHIAIFNVAVFFVALGILAQTFPRFKWHIFLPIILVSPTTYEALLTTNKEIFVLLSAVFMARWIQTKSMTLMFLLILLSAALRWEQALVVLVFLIFIRKKISPRFAAIVLVIGISIAYPSAMNLVSTDIPADIRGTSSSSFYEQINVLQSHGLYFALFIPKMIIAMLSQVVRFWQPFVDPARLHDLPTGPFVLVDQLCMCFVAVASWLKGLWTTENPVVYFVLVYCLIFFAAPENSPRYLYFLFVLMAVVLSSPALQSLRVRNGPKSMVNGRARSVSSGTARPHLGTDAL